MKKLFLCLFILLFMMRVNALEIAKNAKTAILVEATTGKILYEKDKDNKRSPASMTKIMTLLLVMEKLEDIISIKRYFSSKENIDGCHLRGDNIYYYNEEVMNINDIKIKGMHNVENVMASIMAVKEYGVSNEIIREVVSNFKGVEHRLEYVDTVNGVEYYNDTEATNIKCTQIALSSFKKPTIIILGGMERGQDFDELKDYIGNVKTIIAIGQCRNRVQEFGDRNSIPTFSYEFLKDGFKKAWDVSESGDIVLLSPASASWDQYKECEIRGQEFKDLVHQLDKK